LFNYRDDEEIDEYKNITALGIIWMIVVAFFAMIVLIVMYIIEWIINILLKIWSFFKMNLEMEPGDSLWLGCIIITEKQKEQIRLFEDEHWRCHGDKSIRVSSSGIGPNMYIKCHGCSDEKDISPYDRW
jgi:hypothetical protein